ncbi:MAG: hypothetical protein AABZ67_00450 [Pseudomonadota bacterium]
MPWKPNEAKRFTKKADTPKRKRQFAKVANSMLKRGQSEGSAVRAGNAAVKKARAKRLAKAKL